MSVFYRIECPAEQVDWVLGELNSSDCVGVHEEDARLLAYFNQPLKAAEKERLESRILGFRLLGPEAVPDEDWGLKWRQGLKPRKVGSLWVRPSWCPSEGLPELVIDPGQAFGTGEHATTQLCLELLQEALREGDRVLDVGVGSGILALAALQSGARWVCGFDIDPVATPEALRNARCNQMALSAFTGSMDAIAAVAAFDVVAINMISSRLLPLIDPCCTRTRRSVVTSGYLEGEAARIHSAVSAAGFELAAERFREHTGDRWGASLWVRTRGKSGH